jgi:hypothetical protein
MWKARSKAAADPGIDGTSSRLLPDRVLKLGFGDSARSMLSGASKGISG